MMNLPTLPDWLARPLQGSPDDEARERQANQALRKQCVDRSSPRRRPTAPRMTPELQALKDADGLERVRLGDCDLRYLRTPYLRGEQARATRLWQASAPGQPGAPWDRVRTAARAVEYAGRWAASAQATEQKGAGA